jgi:hypothetical protein
MRLLSLLLLLSLVGLSVPEAQAGSKEDRAYLASDTFYGNGYSYCDADHVAQVWGKGDSWDVKVRLGGLLMKGKNAKVEKAIAQGREMADAQGSICEFWSNGYLYEDAEAIGALWGMDAYGAKAGLARMLRYGDWGGVDMAMQKSGRYDEKYYEEPYYDDCDVGYAYGDPQERIAAYAAYDACDAALLAGFWNIPEEQAYARIGKTIEEEGRARVEQDLQSARTFPSDRAKEACDYFQSPYTYEDAELLAQSWGMEDVYAAKTRISEMRLGGKDAVLRSLLTTARGY